ncbi:MAG TPA: FG-GAP-like repeat-containing protein [Blastocatellia bacterium]|nr:FG-GAP-like repeat-containing protein [Blastocatellia bacterium]
MPLTSINVKQAIRNSIALIFCLVFLITAGLSVMPVESSGTLAGSLPSEPLSALGLGESGCTDADFTQPATSPEGAGSQPLSVAVGDFNLDGKADLATANSGSNNVTILLGDGTGNFNQPATSPEGAGTAVSVAAGDFNLDGKPDLATANFGSNNVTILLGDGTGNFTPAATSPEGAGSDAAWVAVGDFNLDRRPDLAVANFSSSNVTILLGDGTGNFTQPATSPEASGSGPAFVAVGDFNLDGRPDLATANATSDNVTILLGDGTGNFNQAATSPEAVGDIPQSVAVGDFNLDGKPDLATGNSDSNNVTILMGDGTGNFNPAATSPEPVGSFPSAVAAGDFNLDGKPDLAVANYVSNNVTILIGDGMGNFTPAATSPEGAGGATAAIAAGDFNLDGRPDLATANFGSNNVTILLNTCTARTCPTNFTQPATSPEGAGGGANSVAHGDFNNDGRPDLATANNGSANVTILLGDGTGNFTQPATSPEAVGNLPVSVEAGDFNRDGRPDLAVSNQGSSNMTILLGDGTGNFTQPATSPEGTGGISGSVAVGDFNGDGRSDIVVTHFFTDDLSILIGDGTGNFTVASASAVGDSPSDVAVGDFNLDGRPDLAVANQRSDNVTILIGNGTGNFTAASTSPEAAGDGAHSVAVGDFNLDGRPDLATANLFSGDVTILLGDGTGNFTPASTSPESAGDFSQSVAVADFNLDGRPDLAVANSGSANVTILTGDGTGNFTQPATSPEGAGPAVSVAVGDFNLDGRPDLATANYNSGNVTILLATCNTPPTVTAQAVSQAADSSSTNKPIATVSDPDQTLQTLSVTISSDGMTFSGSASLNGVTVSSIAVDSMGNVTATVAAACSAADASFTLKVTDDASATDTDTLTVTVTAETGAPTINCPIQPVTANTAPGMCKAVVNFTVTATDNCDTSVSIDCQPPSGSEFQTGTTTVNCTATDDSMNTSTCSFSVVVTDNEPPTITPKAAISLSPANHKYVTVNLAAMVAAVSDNCSSLTINDVVISSVSSDEPDNANGNGDGNTVDDIVIAANCKSVQLRAERADALNGRVYLVTLKLKDTAGNIGTATFRVNVPISAGGTATDSGVSYTVTGCTP